MLEIDKYLSQTEPDCSAGSESLHFILRHPTQDDLESLIGLATNPVLAKSLCCSWLPTTMRTADHWYADLIENPDPVHFPFILNDMKGICLGAACLMLEEDRKQAEVSIMICRDHWQQGLATRATQALVDFAFSNPNTNQPSLEAVTARCRVTCRSSRRVAEKCGFQYCGTGMAHSTHYRGMVPIDRYRIDRGIWSALHHWAGASLLDLDRPPPNGATNKLDVKGAA